MANMQVKEVRIALDSGIARSLETRKTDSRLELIMPLLIGFTFRGNHKMQSDHYVAVPAFQ